MPAWSPEVADEFIRLAGREDRRLNQLQLQKLVYIAHGWCLAITGQPLTGDRPEAWEHGPMYRRLADALAPCGLGPVTTFICGNKGLASEISSSILEPKEFEIIGRVYKDYSGFTAAQLSTLTRRNNAPWEEVYASGAGRHRDIPHQRIRDQFVQLAAPVSTALD